MSVDNKKIVHRVVRRLSELRQSLRVLAFKVASSNKAAGFDPQVSQPLLLVGCGMVHFEEGVSIGFFPSPLYYSGYCHIEAREPSAKVSIGQATQINNNFVAIAERTEIFIGRGCLVGPSVTIFDSDFHALSASDRKQRKPHKAQSVTIEDEVFIGANVTILKGVT